MANIPLFFRPNPIQTPIQENTANNPFTFSPSTTHMSLQLTKHKYTPAKKENKGNHPYYNVPDFCYPYQPKGNPSKIIAQPTLKLSKVKANLNSKFFIEEKLALSVKDSKDNNSKNRDKEVINNELISNSNSQASSNEERSLIENLTQREYSFSKRSKTQSSKKADYEGTIELTNEHTGLTDHFKTFKENDVWMKPINDNFLLDEEEDECDYSDEEVLTQSTQCVIRELCDGINQLNKETKMQGKRARLLSRDFN